MTEPREAEQDPIYMVAADWLVRLRQPDLSLSDTLSWQRWMDQDPRHRQAFLDLEEVWEKLGAVPTQPQSAPEALKADNYDGSVSVSAWMARRMHSEGRSRQPWRLTRLFALGSALPHPMRWAAAAVVLTLVAFGSLPALIAGRQQVRTFETAVGQNASVRLSDGSEVHLGGHTRIDVSLNAQLRQIDLLSGEAFFVVARDRARPFKVRAGSATVTAVGTEFNVRRSQDRVTVSVLEGRVLVQPMAPLLPIAWFPGSRAVGSAEAVSSGQRSTVTGRGAESTQAVGDASSAVAWQQGRLAFEAEPLRDVVQDVNRYADKPIVIADERIGNLQVTGTVAEANIMGWVGSLEAAFGIHADIQSDRIVLRQQ
jgi:transmembrane sensor